MRLILAKLHEDSLKQIFIDKVKESKAPQTVKDRVIEKIKGLPAEAVGSLATAGLSSAIGHIQDVVPLLEKLLK